MNKLEYSKEDLIEMQNGIDKLQQENKRLKNNWNKLKEIVKSQSNLKQKLFHDRLYFEVDEILEMMQELERSDSNE